jgi:hypothetical protein
MVSVGIASASGEHLENCVALATHASAAKDCLGTFRRRQG